MKIYEFFGQSWPGVVRAKGFFWLASRPEYAGEVSQAGAFVTHQGIGQWWAALPKEEWASNPNIALTVEKNWHPDYGDRRQEIVFIGLKDELNEQEIRMKLDACLINDYLSNPKAYHKQSDPFPAWFQQEEIT